LVSPVSLSPLPPHHNRSGLVQAAPHLAHGLQGHHHLIALHRPADGQAEAAMSTHAGRQAHADKGRGQTATKLCERKRGGLRGPRG
jgi:hypothetical protein